MARVYELMNKVHELEEKLRIKQTPPNSKNSSQPPSRDLKSEKRKRKRSRGKGAKLGHEKWERALVEKPDKVIYALVENCETCKINLLDQVPVKSIRRQITEIPAVQPVVIETQPYEVVCHVVGKTNAGNCQKVWKRDVTLVQAWKRL